MKIVNYLDFINERTVASPIKKVEFIHSEPFLNILKMYEIDLDEIKEIFYPVSDMDAEVSPTQQHEYIKRGRGDAINDSEILVSIEITKPRKNIIISDFGGQPISNYEERQNEISQVIEEIKLCRDRLSKKYNPVYLELEIEDNPKISKMFVDMIVKKIPAEEMQVAFDEWKAQSKDIPFEKLTGIVYSHMKKMQRMFDDEGLSDAGECLDLSPEWDDEMNHDDILIGLSFDGHEFGQEVNEIIVVASIDRETGSMSIDEGELRRAMLEWKKENR